MGIFDRAHTVVSSNFNSLLRRLEEPNKDISLLLEEMQTQIHSAQRDLIRIVAESRRNEARAEELLAEIERWEKRAELAIRQGDDGLAREALGQKRRLVEEQNRAQQARSELLQSAAVIKHGVERMKAKRAEYAGGIHVIATRASLEQKGGGVENLGQTGSSNPFERLRGVEESIERTDAYAAAHAELDDLLSRTPLGTMTRAELDQRFAELTEKESSSAAEAEPSKDERAARTHDATAPEAATSSTGEQTPDGPSLRLRVRVEP
jgi:phage shock protein A